MFTAATVSEILKRNIDGVLPGAEWSSKVDVYVNDNDYSVKMNAPSYTPFMINGRGPGKRPPQEPIKEWLRQKGMAEELYWAVSNKIMNEGTEGIGSEFLDNAAGEIEDLQFKAMTDELDSELLK